MATPSYPWRRGVANRTRIKLCTISKQLACSRKTIEDLTFEAKTELNTRKAKQTEHEENNEDVYWTNNKEKKLKDEVCVDL